MRSLNCLLRTVACGVFILLLNGTVLAQFNAGVQGSVKDSSGALVPEALVTLTNRQTNQSQQVTASDEGFYRFSALPPGEYSLKAEKPGFEPTTLNITVRAESIQGFDVTLNAAGAAATVTVTDVGEQVLQTENANVDKVITTQEVLRLPQVGRDPYELARLAPGVFGAGARSANGESSGLPNTSGPGASNLGIFATENRPPISANGQRVSANNFQIDGVSVNSQTWGGAAVITPTQESVKEVEVTSSTYNAMDGRNSGAQVKVVTQNGTNDFHGSAFFKYNTPAWNAFNKGFTIPGTTRGVAPTRVENRDKTFGGSLGGPIVKDKLFFFFAYEGLRNSGNDFFEGFVDTPEFRQLIRTARPNSIAATVVSQPGVEPRVVSVLNRSCSDFNFPAPTVMGAPNCQVVPGGFDIGSPVLGVGQYVPLSGEFGLGGGLDGIPDVQRALLQNPRSTKVNQYVTRIDFSPSDKDRFAFTLFYTPAELFTSNRGAQSRPMADIRSDRLNWNTAFTYIRTFSPTVINEARFNITKWGFNEIDANPDVNFGIPRIEIESFIPDDRLRYGADRSENTPGLISERQLDFRDTITWFRGNQAWTFGGEYRKDDNNNTGTGGARPLYSFVRWNFVNDTPIFEAINADANGNPQANNAPFNSGALAFFFQNDWKARPNLTVNLGLRWEYFQPIKSDQLGNLELGPNGLTDARIVTVERLTEPDWTNFGPQFGFAWSPERFDTKLVLRGGAGVGYDRLPSAILANTRANPPNGQRYNLCCGTAVGEFGSPFIGGQIVYALGSSNDPTSFPRHPLIGGGVNPVTGGPNNGRIEVWGVQSNLRTGHVFRYSLEGQYELFWRLVGTLGYQGSASRKFTRIEPLHLTQPGIESNFPFSPVFFGKGDVSGNYNGMNARLQRRFADGFQIDFNYRFSKSLDTYSFEAPCGCTNQTFPIDQSTEYGPSDYDVRHYWTVSGLWDLPFYRNQKTWTGKVLGGWQINGIATHHSGFPWTPILSNSLRGPNGNFFGPVRPISYFGGQPDSNTNDNFLRPGGIFPGGGSQYFSTSLVGNDFFSNPPGVGRNVFRGPKYFNVDMSVSKKFGLPGLGVLGEAPNLDLRFNFFNIFNIRNLAPFQSQSDSTRVDNPRFGEPTGVLAGRVVEFQARFSF